RRCEEIAQRENILLTTHLAESPEEMEMFRDATGPLYEFLKSIGRSMDDCGKRTPLENFLDLIGSGGSLKRQKTIYVKRLFPFLIWGHLKQMTESDFDFLEKTKPPFQNRHFPLSA